MNAFTSSDHTTYPFATTNHQDYANLMSVYLDATLNPLLNEQDFLQEGWRIGPQHEIDGHPFQKDQVPLEFKGEFEQWNTTGGYVSVIYASIRDGELYAMLGELEGDL